VSEHALERTLSRDAYVAPAFLDLERERIFAREWVLVGRAESMPAAGDSLEVNILGESLFIVRAQDDALRAFFNVCRHRGCALVGVGAAAHAGAPRTGHVGQAIRCPYHSWTYGLDGALRAAPFLEDALIGRKQDFSLYQAGLALWGGFVFVSLDPAAAAQRGHTLKSQFGRSMTVLANYPLADLRTARRIVYDVAANWKVIVENYNECYHCAGVHPELCKIVPAFREGGGASLDWEHGVPHREGAVTFTMSGQTTRAPFPGLDEFEKIRHKGELIYPNLMLSASMDHVTAFMLLPQSPGRTLVVCDFLFHPAEMAKPGFDPSDAVDFWDMVNRQDWTVCEGVQRGMNSRRFDQGYYAPMESPSADIRRYVGERIPEAGAVPPK
jgi:glycine betaine catabolism A